MVEMLIGAFLLILGFILGFGLAVAIANTRRNDG